MQEENKVQAKQDASGRSREKIGQLGKTYRCRMNLRLDSVLGLVECAMFAQEGFGKSQKESDAALGGVPTLIYGRVFVFLVPCFLFGVSVFGFRGLSFGFRVSGIKFRISGFGFRVSGFVFGGIGFRVSGFGG